MRKMCGVLFVLAIFLCATTSVQATLLFDYQGEASNVVTVGPVTSTATAAPGALYTSAAGYGVVGNGTDEINLNEVLTITFDTHIYLESILFTNSNGGDNDLVEMYVDLVPFNFFTDFGSNHPEAMTSRATNVGSNAWELDFTGLGVNGSEFAFLIPALPPGTQAPGTAGSEYTLGAMTVAMSAAPAPVPEPSTFLLLGAGLTGLAGVSWRRRKNG